MDSARNDLLPDDQLPEILHAIVNKWLSEAHFSRIRIFCIAIIIMVMGLIGNELGYSSQSVPREVFNLCNV